MDSATKNAHTRKIARFNMLLCFLSSSAPLFICLPLALLFLSHTLFLPALGKNYLRIYTPDSLLSCIVRLIPKFLSFFLHWSPCPFFSFPFPSYFLPSSLANLYSYSLFFFLPFPFSFFSPSLSPSLLFHSSLIFFPSPKSI